MRSHCVLVRGGPQRSRSAVRFSERLAITSSCSETLFTKIIGTFSSSRIRKGRFLSGWKRLSWFHQKKVWINTSFHTYQSMYSSNDSLMTTERIPLSHSLPLTASLVCFSRNYLQTAHILQSNIIISRTCITVFPTDCNWKIISK